MDIRKPFLKSFTGKPVRKKCHVRWAVKELNSKLTQSVRQSSQQR